MSINYASIIDCRSYGCTSESYRDQKAVVSNGNELNDTLNGNCSHLGVSK